MRRALDIPEILEAILVQLPPLDLIEFQQVNKTFKSVIDRSIEIQYKAFLKPRPERTDGKATLNSFLRHVLGGQGDWVSIIVCEQDSGVCSYLDRLIGRSNFTQSSDEHLVPATASILISIGHSTEEFIRRRARTGSYMGMEIADPPIRVELQIGEGKLSIVQGDTLGDIVEAFSGQGNWL